MKKFLAIALATSALALTGAASAQEEDPAVAFLGELNANLEARGEDIRVLKMELLGSGDGLNMGRTVLAKDVGNKQLGADWVPNDPRRLSGSPGLVYAIDGVETTFDLPVFDQFDRVRFGFEEWDTLGCSNIGITEIDGGVVPANIGFIGALVGAGDIPFFGADLVHAGFKSNPQILGFDPNGTIAANFTFVFTSGGVATDIDNNGRNDVALKETYYNDLFTYTDDQSGAGIDLATVALHESGHALSRAHFGDVSVHKGRLKTSPDAVMNAIYAGPRRELLGPDKGGHCSDWGAWPNNN